jgi:fructan beta-fructosidase
MPAFRPVARALTRLTLVTIPFLVSEATFGECYNEPLRPQFHFTYQRGWLSDINGLFYYDGEYHFFSQHNPAGPGLDYRNIHWGHAVSTDLMHWTELPPAIEPDATGPIFSGSCVVDWNNTSGLQTGEEPVIIAFYTAAGYILSADRDGTQCIAFSNDRGRTWTKYAGNPVLPPVTHYNRDPKVFRHEPTGKWIMVITLSCADHWLRGEDGDYRFAFYASTDLKRWTELSRFDMPRGLDCPDMFELPVDGESENTRWVFWAGDGTHAIGTFDGVRFDPTDGIHPPLVTWEEQGANGYAAQTFSDIPARDGRRIQIAWLRALEHGGYPGMPFNQQALIPVELTLRRTSEGIRLFREPVREIELLHGRAWRWRDLAIRPGDDPLAEVTGELFHVRTEIDPGSASRVTLRVRGHELRYDPALKTLSFAAQTIRAGTPDGTVRLELLIDRTSLEIFADRGRTSMSFFLAPHATTAPLGIESVGGRAKLKSLDVWEMHSIWRAAGAEPAAATDQ